MVVNGWEDRFLSQHQNVMNWPGAKEQRSKGAKEQRSWPLCWERKFPGAGMSNMSIKNCRFTASMKNKKEMSTKLWKTGEKDMPGIVPEGIRRGHTLIWTEGNQLIEVAATYCFLN